jgi:hypothetical protein
LTAHLRRVSATTICVVYIGQSGLNSHQ